jgi:hypothetical protein
MPLVVRKAMACAAVLLITATSVAQEKKRSRVDGNWWRDLDEYARLVYVTAFDDGMLRGMQYSTWGLKDSKGNTDEASRRKIVESFTHYYFLTQGATTGQLSEGLDKFFEDYRNRRISVSDGYWVVVNTLIGTSDADIDTLTKNYRQNSSQ